MHITSLIRFIFFYRGEGVGDGPLRSMWTALLAKILSQTNHWIQTTDNYFSPSNPLPTTISNEDIQHFQLYGFIIRQSLIWGLDILPISPFLLGLLFQDLESVWQTITFRLLLLPPLIAYSHGLLGVGALFFQMDPKVKS